MHWLDKAHCPTQLLKGPELQSDPWKEENQKYLTRALATTTICFFPLPNWPAFPPAGEIQSSPPQRR